MFSLDKKARKSAISKKMDAESTPDLESQFEAKDAANGQDNAPSSMEQEAMAQPQQEPGEGTPTEELSDMVTALSLMADQFQGNDAKLVSQALEILSQVSGVNQGEETPDGTPSAEEGEDLTNAKGGVPVGPTSNPNIK